MVVALMALTGTKAARLARELQLDPGGISGWLRGTPSRISIKNKAKIADYFNIINGELSREICHFWKAADSVFNEQAEKVIGEEKMSQAKVHRIYSDDGPVGLLIVVGGNKINPIALVVAPPHAGSHPFSLLTSGSQWGKIGEDLKIKKNLWSDWQLSHPRITLPEFLGECIALTAENPDQSDNLAITEEWLAVVKGAVSKGITPQQAVAALKLNIVFPKDVSD